jgi:hypothetical protein
MLVAPAAARALGDFERVLGYLSSLGTRAFYPVLPYADITVWVYYQFLKQNPEKTLIASACVGMNRYLSQNPPGAGAICPRIFSPLLCGARYLQKYCRTEDRFAFLSPCAIKWTEFTLENQEQLIHYHVPIDALDTWLKEQGVDLTQYAGGLSMEQDGTGQTVAAFGGIGKTLAALQPGLDYQVEQGIKNAAACLESYGNFTEDLGETRILEPYACAGGCSCGPRVRGLLKQASPAILQPGTPDGTPGDITKLQDLFSYYDKTLDLADFCHQAS